MIFKNFSDLIEYSSRKYSKKTFLLSANKNYKNLTFNELKKFKENFQVFLDNHKIKEKDRILVVMHNSNLLTLLFLSIISNFRIFVPLNPTTAVEEIKYILAQTKPKIIIGFDIYKKKLLSLNIKKKFFIKDEQKFINYILNIKSSNCKKKKIKGNFIAQILFTSGSTGKPKGVVLTHYSILSNLDGIKKRLGIKIRKPKFLAVTPLFHNNGQFIPTLLPLVLGGTSTPIPSDTSILNFWEVSSKNQINYSSVMATHINYFVKIDKKRKHGYLKTLFCGGAKLDEDTRKRFEKKFKIKIACNYGLTETSSIVASEGNGGEHRREKSVGKSLHNNQIKIYKKSRRDKYGEILVKGDNLFQNYLNRIGLTRSKFSGKWFKTGDLGFIDNKNFLYIKERKDNMINVSGENIYPSDIENYIAKYSKIKLGIVSSIPDEITQNKLVLVYEGKKFSELHMIKYLSKYVSKFKIPKIIISCKDINLKEIPKAPNKKILRAKLREHLVKNLSLLKKFNKF